MRRISSKATFFYKRVFPIFWFGLIALSTSAFLIGPVYSGSVPPLPPMAILAGTAVFGYFMMKKLVFDLVDEVVDAGEALVVRNGDQDERIPFSEIMNVSYSAFVNPPRVTLSLRRPGAFGSKVSFCAPKRFVPFSTSPVIDELIERIDAKRRC